MGVPAPGFTARAISDLGDPLQDSPTRFLRIFAVLSAYLRKPGYPKFRAVRGVSTGLVMKTG
jgi:hypothetical protein